MYLCLYFIFHYLPVDPYLLFAVVPYLRGQGEGKDDNFPLCVHSPPYWICKPRRVDWRRVAQWISGKRFVFSYRCENPLTMKICCIIGCVCITDREPHNTNRKCPRPRWLPRRGTPRSRRSSTLALSGTGQGGSGLWEENDVVLRRRFGSLIAVAGKVKLSESPKQHFIRWLYFVDSDAGNLNLPKEGIRLLFSLSIWSDELETGVKYCVNCSRVVPALGSSRISSTLCQ